MLGFTGYAIAGLLVGMLAWRWGFSLGERLVAVIAPPVAFIIAVAIATVVVGREWIVFYQTTYAGAVAVIALGLAIDGPIWRLLDTTLLGIGVFLVFGRIGCFHVACCHGRPARRGVIYGPAHVAVGLWPRWAGRPLIPTQLIESAGTLVLVVTALLASSTASDVRTMRHALA